MSFEHYLRSGTRLLRCGYTTGSCAALAAMGAARLLLTGERPETLALVTPKGLRVEICPSRCGLEGNAACCTVIKDAGDDPDVTNGIEISALVKKTEQGIEIDGGRGVGRVTKPGLDQPVGNAAINSVPRKMILAAVESVCAACGYGGGLSVIIEAGGGEEIAQKTFNPQLGIVGGISILGTSGIVEPMSEQALLDTIALEIRQAKTADHKRLILTPGSYGMDFLTGKLPELKEVPRAKCSNFIGDAIDMAVLEGAGGLFPAAAGGACRQARQAGRRDHEYPLQNRRLPAGAVLRPRGALRRGSDDLRRTDGGGQHRRVPGRSGKGGDEARLHEEEGH